MRHYGDICKLSGYDLPPVDCITGGSPCQDLSVAGNREGLFGERSGLFMEQIRIVKEMRERDKRELHGGRSAEFIRPRFMVWENVPGAFSSNGGEDFQAVLTEIVRIADADAPAVPMPPKNKWSKAGCIYDEMGRWSVAWRVHDAQFWGATQYVNGRMLNRGTPQRRKRIALVADFGGLSAPEICFVRKGLCGDLTESGKERQETAEAAGGCAKNTAIGFNRERCGAVALAEAMPTLQATAGESGNNKPMAFCIQGGGTTSQQSRGDGINRDISFTLNAIDRHAAYSFDSVSSNSMKSANPNSGCRRTEIAKTLDCFDQSPAKNQGGICVVETYQNIVGTIDCGITKGTGNQLAAQDMFVTRDSSVRRLTPLECERLQGFPDHWTDIGDWTDSKGKKHKASDSPRYKALGNSIALPFWFWLLRRISAQYERPATLGSLFDGIGGFPLCWERCNGKGTAIWASEIEEFPIAVTKKHFPEE